MDSKEQYEVLQMLAEMAAGDASERDYTRLDEMVRADPEVRQLVVDGLVHLADLEWEHRTSSDSNGSAAVTPAIAHALVADAAHRDSRTSGWRRPAYIWCGLAASFVLGASCAWWLATSSPTAGPSGSPPLALQVPESNQAVPIATLVSNTSKMWDTQAGVAMTPGAAIQPGRSVAMFEGSAEIQLDTGLNLRVSGPAILSLSPLGVPEIKYGKALIHNADEEETQIKLPMATSFLAPGSLIGVDAFGDEVVVHAFEVDAQLVPDVPAAKSVTVSTGVAKRLRTDAHSQLKVHTTEADVVAFEFCDFLSADLLAISPAYDDLILESGPVAYWRFEDDTSPVVPNEVGPQYALHALGKAARVVRGTGNGYAEFRLRDKTGAFIASQPLDAFASPEYTIEMWVRPSHFHRGVLVSVVQQDRDRDGSVERHGLLLETNAAHPLPAGKEGRPKALRFLHRSPPHEMLGGTSCFSAEPYLTRSWQHVAAVHNNDRMLLYVDGKVTAEQTDASTFPRQLTLVLGQLFSFGTVRPFVGDLDEVAVYDRALSIDEIAQRVKAVHPHPQVSR